MIEEKWQCDKCKKTIYGAENAWLKWNKNLNDGTLYNFRIEHHPACEQPTPKVQRARLAEPGDPLTEYLGKDGLIRLLELVAQSDSTSKHELLELIQRLHIPGYEAAHVHFESAYKEGKIIPPVESVYYPNMQKIKEINDKYN